MPHIAREAGIPTLWDSGMHHVLSGATSLAELLDNVPPPEMGDAAPQEDIDALLAQLLGGAREKPVTAKQAAATPVPQPVRAAPPAAKGRARRLRVLVVDGDAAVRRVRARELAHAGFTVIEAGDGATALELAKHVRADIVLTEASLPGLDAVGLIGALATRRSSAVVVVLASRQDDATERTLTESGAHAVLRRDVSTAELGQTLRELVRA